MFSLEKKHEDGFDKIILKDDVTGTYAVILPGCGAVLHSFVVLTNGEAVNVIDSYNSADDFKKNAESKGFLGAKLSPFVCRLNHGKYQFAGQKYKFKNFYLGKHALHGLLYNKAFTVTDEAANDAECFATMKYDYRGEDPGYPFNYDCKVTWQLENDNKLSVTTECINKDDGLIVIQDGWHPYFNLHAPVDELQLEFQSKEMVEFNSELLPTGNLIPYSEFGSLKEIGSTAFDNCFTLNTDSCQPLCVLRNPAKKIEIELHPAKSYPYLQIYIPPHRNNIAIENISGAPNAFNNGMGFITLEPRASAVFKATYKIKLLK